MNIAFYAPMKPPSAPVPSGDRTMARALVGALQFAGHKVEIAARLRAREPTGDSARQQRLRTLGEALADRAVRRYRARPAAERPHIWFTYHLYYKAPDWIGPRVADALGIPYVLAEASFAPKRAAGPWAESHRAVRDAIVRADLVFDLNSANEACVQPLLKTPDRLVRLRPFVCALTPTLPQRERERRGNDVRLLTVAMMRSDAKLRSYRVLAEALALLPRNGWTLTVVGDGPAERDVRALFENLPVKFAGRREGDTLAEYYAVADLFVWPAVDEGFGMATVEAQAAGVPVVVGRAGGVSDTVRDGVTGVLTPMGDAAAFAAAISGLLADPVRRRRMGAQAARLTREQGFAAAARLMDEKLRALMS